MTEGQAGPFPMKGLDAHPHTVERARPGLTCRLPPAQGTGLETGLLS